MPLIVVCGLTPPPSSTLGALPEMLTIHTPKAEANSRLIGLRFALMTLRLMEHWRAHLNLDHDSALIAMATVAITMEKFTRADLKQEHCDIRAEIPSDQLTKCNVRSIAAATGLNRETTRRKVKALVASGVLLREGASLRLSPEYTRSVQTSDLLRSLLETLVHSTNELAREGVLRSRG